MIKQALEQLKAELLKTAEAHEALKMQKCAQILLAATGLELLASRMGLDTASKNKNTGGT